MLTSTIFVLFQSVYSTIELNSGSNCFQHSSRVFTYNLSPSSHDIIELPRESRFTKTFTQLTFLLHFGINFPLLLIPNAVYDIGALSPKDGFFQPRARLHITSYVLDCQDVSKILLRIFWDVYFFIRDILSVRRRFPKEQREETKKFSTSIISKGKYGK